MPSDTLSCPITIAMQVKKVLWGWTALPHSTSTVHHVTYSRNHLPYSTSTEGNESLFHPFWLHCIHQLQVNLFTYGSHQLFMTKFYVCVHFIRQSQPTNAKVIEQPCSWKFTYNCTIRSGTITQYLVPGKWHHMPISLPQWVPGVH